MIINIAPANVVGLGEKEQAMLGKLVETYVMHASNNAEKL